MLPYIVWKILRVLNNIVFKHIMQVYSASNVLVLGIVAQKRSNTDKSKVLYGS